MAAGDGNAVGYFFALVVLICIPPCTLLAIGKWRRWKYGESCFEAKLSLAAREYIDTSRIQAMCVLFHENEKSWKNRTMSFMRNSITDSPAPSRDARLEFFRHELKQCNVFWGIGDIFVPAGLLTLSLFNQKWEFQFPPGLIEDWLFYVSNSINPLPFIFGEPKHPERLPSRFVIYCTSQAFALLVYLLCANNSVAAQLLSIIITPIVMFVENWLHYMLVCPCLGEDFDDAEKSSQPNPYFRPLRILLRTLGGLLALPLLIILILIFYVAAVLLSSGDIERVYLARFLWDGLLLPLLLKLLITSTNFFWMIYPTHVNVCNMTLLTINSWTEVQYCDYDLSADLDQESVRDASAIIPLSVDVFNWSCNCLRYSGYNTDTHYNCDVCQTSCYGTRCCDMLSAWYFETPQPHAFTRDLSQRKLEGQQSGDASRLKQDFLQSSTASDTLKESLLTQVDQNS